MKILALIIASALILSGCGAPAGESGNTYAEISQQEAAEIMASGEEIIILDVRRPDEFASGHIPGALNIPNEEIGTEEIPELPDKDAVILVYCRSGNRSRQASEKLAELGYTGVMEFGGINTWQGEIVSG